MRIFKAVPPTLPKNDIADKEVRYYPKQVTAVDSSKYNSIKLTSPYQVGMMYSQTSHVDKLPPPPSMERISYYQHLSLPRK